MAPSALVIPAYAQVHVLWTIPVASVLFLAGRPLRTSREVIKTCALITIAVLVRAACAPPRLTAQATIPWDSYLIRARIWTYPPQVVFGPTLLSIPLEELFFFVIQTYITASLYALLSRPVVHAVLLSKSDAQGRFARQFGTAVLLATTLLSARAISVGGEGTYLALILVWVSPFLALIWFLSSDHIIAMHRTSSSIALSIGIPTVYLWTLDFVALQRGTWVIESGTKLGWSYMGLEIEEAVFFLLTNVLIVFGLAACDKSLAIHDVFHEHYPLGPAQFPSPVSVIRSMTTPPSAYASSRLSDLQVALSLLKDKSKSFYTASMVFEGKLKLDLLSLYAFCRVADDLVDEAPSIEEATVSLDLIAAYLDLIYPSSLPSALPSPPASSEKADLILAALPPASRSVFKLLATLPVPRAPLDELVSGFRTDLAFSPATAALPIRTDADLTLYSQNVASSVAELCVRLVWENEGSSETTPREQQEIIDAARTMGVALQLVNICRDVPADLLIGRMYLPGLALTASDAAKTAERLRLLALAREMAASSEAKIELLPLAGRNGIRAACAVYLEIGHAVERELALGNIESRATVSKWRRFRVAWAALG